MRYRLASSPPWVIGLLTGSFFAVFTGGLRLLMGDPVGEVVVASVFAGAMFGVIMGPVTGRNTAWMLGRAVELPPEMLRQVIRASSRGPVPEDQELRTAAWQLASRRHDYARRMRAATVVALAIMAAISFGAAAHCPGGSWRPRASSCSRSRSPSGTSYGWLAVSADSNRRPPCPDPATGPSRTASAYVRSCRMR